MATTFDRLTTALRDRYTLERELGEGAMATVYLAVDLKHRRSVAIKVLRPDVATVLGAERFLREIEIAARLTHPHILPLHDSGEADGLLYYVMPFVEGESLRTQLARATPFSLEQVLHLARAVAGALDYAHRQGIVHRDIKPANILLVEGHAVVADFGVARALTAAGGDKLTLTGHAVGTPRYMSPEQAAGHPNLDGRTDIYSLGVVVYELLVGGPPRPLYAARDSLGGRFAKLRAGHRERLDALPRSVEPALITALASEPEARFATATEFVEALTAAPAVGLSAPAPDPEPAPLVRFWRRISLGTRRDADSGA